MAANYRFLRDRAGGRTPAGIVKADAYGLGAVPIARRLVAEGCSRLFVARLDEALELLAAFGPATGPTGSTGPGAGAGPEILVLDGVGPGQAGELVAGGLTPVLNDLGQLQRWTDAAVSAGRTLRAALHFDTGMTRLGFPATEADEIGRCPDLLRGLEVVLVMSHLASADVVGSPQPAEQLARFRDLRSRFRSGDASLANSAGIFLGSDYHFDLVRPGIAVYGGSPQPGSGSNPMTPVVTVEVPVLQVQDVGAGTPVGYGATWRAAAPTRLATLPVGYADGFPRAAGQADHGTRRVAIGGTPVPIVGRVSMDLVVVDIGDLPDGVVVAGTPVEVIGPNCPLEEVAAAAGTIANEILTGLGDRYRRIYREARSEPGEGHSH